MMTYLFNILQDGFFAAIAAIGRSEERRVGKECRCGWSRYHEKKKKKKEKRKREGNGKGGEGGKEGGGRER